MRITCKQSKMLFINLVLLFVHGVTTSQAQQSIKIAGRHTLVTIKEYMIEVGDTVDHIISLNEYEGRNVSTGENKFMDGALDIGMTFADIVKGRGPHEGYGNFSLNGDTIFWKHEGKIDTTLSSEGKSDTTVEGTFTYTKGTGKYQNIQGSGTYKGKSISKRIMVVDWQGEYFIKK